MSEWWTYSLSDFLMFSVRTYYRQFELMNREWWPLPLLMLAAGLFLIRATSQRYGFLLLGMIWLWVGWAWHAGRYADINSGALYFATAFGMQGLLLAGMAASGRETAGRPGLPALSIVLVAFIAYPVLAPLDGRSWWQAEVFGIAPDPTCAATLGLLLAWRAPWYQWVIPLLWSIASAATLLELHAPAAWLLPALALVAMGMRMGAARSRT